MAFRYAPVPFGTVIKPIIPLIFINKNDSDDYIGEGFLVDSGADISLISTDLADRINIKYDDIPVTGIGGVGGKAVVKRSSAEIILIRAGEAYKLEIPVDILIKGSLVYPLLGRIPLFDLFDITFRQHKLRVDFKNLGELDRIKIPEKLLFKKQKSKL